jgi:hypothetical protein
LSFNCNTENSAGFLHNRCLLIPCNLLTLFLRFFPALFGKIFKPLRFFTPLIKLFFPPV